MNKRTISALAMLVSGVYLIIGALFIIFIPDRFFPEELRTIISKNPEVWSSERN